MLTMQNSSTSPEHHIISAISEEEQSFSEKRGRQQHIKEVKSKKNQDVPFRVPQRRISRMGVCFSSNVNVRHTLHINRYTPEEVHACFWSEREIQESWDEVLNILDWMEDSSTFETNDICLRGLENRTSNGRERILKRREDSKFAVFREQLLRDYDSPNIRDEMIARAYAKKTQKSRRIAHLTGIFDYEEVNFNNKS